MEGKHKLQLYPAQDVVQSTTGILDQNKGLWFYEDYYKADTGQIDQYVLVWESRGKQTPPDHREVGLTTGYCQGPNHKYELTCPSWVNSSL